MVVFPRQKAAFTSLYAPSKSKLVVQDAIESDAQYGAVNVHVSQNQISFDVKQEGLLFVNSFLPAVTIDFHESVACTRVEADFKLRPVVSVFLYVIILIAAIFEAGMLALSFRGNLSDPLLLCIPFMIVLFALLLSHFGLKFSSKPIINLVSDLLEH